MKISELENIFKYFCKYELDKLHSVTDNPGVYCWYAELKIEKIDWKPEQKVFLESIKSGIKKYRANALKAKVSTSFGLNWEETIHESSSERWEEHVQSILLEDSEEHDFSKMNDLFEKVEARQLVSEALNMMSPIFNVPLYIGKAYNLNIRLDTHKKRFDHFESFTPEDSEYAFNFGEDFAERAIGAGFSPEELYVYVLDIKKFSEEIGIKNLSSKDLKQLSLIVEYILNRRLRPVLGRI